MPEVAKLNGASTGMLAPNNAELVVVQLTENLWVGSNKWKEQYCEITVNLLKYVLICTCLVNPFCPSCRVKGF